MAIFHQGFDKLSPNGGEVGQPLVLSLSKDWWR